MRVVGRHVVPSVVETVLEWDLQINPPCTQRQSSRQLLDYCPVLRKLREH